MNPHPTTLPSYWRDLARNERAFAARARRCRSATAESVIVHERNAAAYEERARELESKARIVEVSKRDGPQCPDRPSAGPCEPRFGPTGELEGNGLGPECRWCGRDIGRLA